jgi:nucleotide-binding universal stress UspA family protein
MNRILLPVDGSTGALEAVEQAIREAQSAPNVEVHLLNVQPRTIPEESKFAMSAEDIDTYYFRRSAEALEAAEKRLLDAGVRFQTHRSVGPVADGIIDKQRELDCDAILMGTRGHGRLINAILGSVSSRVLSMADVPVTLVNARHVPDFSGRLAAT